MCPAGRDKQRSSMLVQRKRKESSKTKLKFEVAGTIFVLSFYLRPISYK
jgi:hypothetical protein